MDMIKNERVSIPQAAKELGMSAQGLREHIKAGYLGHVMPSVSGRTKTYFVYREELEAFKRGQTVKDPSEAEQKTEALTQIMTKLIQETIQQMQQTQIN